MFYKLRSALYAIWLLVTGQAKLASSYVQNKRLNTCYSCELRDQKKDICTACGCYIPIKIKIKHSSCPVGKW